jgi:hypothetical protein
MELKNFRMSHVPTKLIYLIYLPNLSYYLTPDLTNLCLT